MSENQITPPHHGAWNKILNLSITLRLFWVENVKVWQLWVWAFQIEPLFFLFRKQVRNFIVVHLELSSFISLHFKDTLRLSQSTTLQELVATPLALWVFNNKDAIWKEKHKLNHKDEMDLFCFFYIKLNYTSEKTFPNYYVRFLSSIVEASNSWFPRVVQKLLKFLLFYSWRERFNCRQT